MEALQNTPHEMPKQQQKTGKSLYQTIWRWHFYAGIIFTPFLIILALSGAVYLFKPQIENTLYKDLYFVESKGEKLAVSKQMDAVKQAYPSAVIAAVTVRDEANRTNKVSVLEKGKMFSVYVNPYTGKVVGELQPEKEFMTIFKKLHSELIVGGTVANRLVELAACWAVILLATGLYIWWPRNKASIWGTVLPRLNKRGRTLWRDLHAVPAFWLTGGILLLIVTGLPWSGVMGEQINKLATATHTGYPTFSFGFGPKPESATLTKDIAKDVPWATENLPVPASQINGYVPLSVDDINKVARAENIKAPYTLSMPQGPKGVYSITTSHTKPGDNATLHVDQYSGAVLSDVRYEDYGVMAKGITLGIALHEGRLFGLANQLLGLVICLGLIGICVSSFVMWRKRKPINKAGAPAPIKDKRVRIGVMIIMLLCGLIMPLVGISIIAVLILDKLIITNIKPLRNWLSA
ncbi:PepSY-associated TM helix domain-containing protein [Ectobacillus antri]|uniref:PepSY-associated TM helix domain-containing protein n=1 Tax=Ectobacillus antri TaxID=2486280 RepID=UPI000F5A6802|nr:PepSY domain-containing protein [Ectobacillus antri]